MSSSNIKMEQIRKQNQKMQRIVQSYLEEIQKQKELNYQHQNQIQSLLKFNQRLLNIIETEMGQNNNRRDTGSLLPISQRSERQSDMMNPLNSLIKTRKTLIARSQIGGTRSVMENNSSYMQRLQALGKNLQHSQFIRSEDIDESYLLSVPNKSHYRNTNQQNQRKYSDMTSKIEEQVSRQMKNFYNCAQKNKSFYEVKINELKNLSNRIGVYKPEDKFNQISRKVQMSPGTANLVKKAMLAR